MSYSEVLLGGEEGVTVLGCGRGDVVEVWGVTRVMLEGTGTPAGA